MGQIPFCATHNGCASAEAIGEVTRANRPQRDNKPNQKHLLEVEASERLPGALPLCRYPSWLRRPPPHRRTTTRTGTWACRSPVRTESPRRDDQPATAPFGTTESAPLEEPQRPSPPKRAPASTASIPTRKELHDVAVQVHLDILEVPERADAHAPRTSPPGRSPPTPLASAPTSHK